MVAKPLAISIGLSFRYQHAGDPNDDFGWLAVEVNGEQFSGKGGFWVQWQDVRDFGEKLATYPIIQDAPVEASWGYEPWEGDSLVTSVSVAPADTRGNLSVQVWLRDYTENGKGKPLNCVRTTFKTNYPDLETFRQGIAQLMDGKSDEAILVGQ